MTATDAFGLTGQCYSSNGNFDPYQGFGAQYGYYFDPETTQTLCGLRNYDSFQARWLTRDPIGQSGGINLYAYVGGNPIMGIDPLGLWNFYKWIYTGDGDASDDVYISSLNQSAATMTSWGGTYGRGP